MADGQTVESGELAQRALPFWELVAGYSPAELRQLAQVKRFMERIYGDSAFRARLAEQADTPETLAGEYGIELDPRLVLPLFHEEFKSPDAFRDFPLAELWANHMRGLVNVRGLLRHKGGTPHTNPTFHAWRERQIKRTDGECGAVAQAIVHPVVALELCDGCSVGCWFCGISAEKFKGAFPYSAKNAELWRGVIQVLKRHLGDAVQTGFCYWATDPLDNPDYPRFLEDFYQATGFLPQTTTALPLKDLQLTRQVLSLFNEHGSVVNRFSILSRRALDEVHRAFSADELLGVELIMQNKESIMRMAGAGRARETRHRMDSRGQDSSALIAKSELNTIACVSGFLVNMVNRTLRLVSPTRPTERWPDGYKVLGTARFSDVESFDSALARLVSDKVYARVSGGQSVRFRTDLRFKRLDAGFEVSSATQRHRFNSEPFHSGLGELVSDGNDTPGSLTVKLVEAGACIFAVQRALAGLHEAGLLLEADELEAQRSTGLPVLN